jgi:hypothetical protein
VAFSFTALLFGKPPLFFAHEPIFGFRCLML